MSDDEAPHACSLEPARSDGDPADQTRPPLGDFDLLREIGRGGMGVVHEARQRSLNRCVVLKVLPPGLGLTSQAVQRFEREAHAAAKLPHRRFNRSMGIHHGHFFDVEDNPLSKAESTSRHGRWSGGEVP